MVILVDGFTVLVDGLDGIGCVLDVAPIKLRNAFDHAGMLLKMSSRDRILLGKLAGVLEIWRSMLQIFCGGIQIGRSMLGTGFEERFTRDEGYSEGVFRVAYSEGY